MALAEQRVKRRKRAHNSLRGRPVLAAEARSVRECRWKVDCARDFALTQEIRGNPGIQLRSHARRAVAMCACPHLSPTLFLRQVTVKPLWLPFTSISLSFPNRPLLLPYNV